MLHRQNWFGAPHQLFPVEPGREFPGERDRAGNVLGKGLSCAGEVPGRNSVDFWDAPSMGFPVSLSCGSIPGISVGYPWIKAGIPAFPGINPSRIYPHRDSGIPVMSGSSWRLPGGDLFRSKIPWKKVGNNNRRRENGLGIAAGGGSGWTSGGIFSMEKAARPWNCSGRFGMSIPGGVPGCGTQGLRGLGGLFQALGFHESPGIP